MKKLALVFLPVSFILLVSSSCGNEGENTTALDEQRKTELNQRDLNAIQPAPKISWSLERDNLIKRFKLQNDRSISFYMYVFVEGVGEPIGYYQVNKVSSVNSQLTNTEQLVDDPNGDHSAGSAILPSPAEDGSYGTNGDAVFGFTPEDIYIEHNMHYMVSTVPLSFTKPVNRLTVINVQTEKQLKEMMAKIR
jgi:hypothetical protein